jgi:hypothetical protein
MSLIRSAAFDKARKKFLPYNGVIGVGLGPKLRKGKVVSLDAIIVLVTKKLSMDDVPEDEQIPQFFEGFPVDIRVPRLELRGEGRKGFEFEETEYQWIDWGKIHRLHQLQQSVRVSTKREG